MEKAAQEKSRIDPGVVARFALGGLISGGATMSLINLVRMLKHMNNYRQDMTKSPETDENTIVLSLPNKTSEVSGATALSSVSKVTGPSSKTTATTYTPKNQFRHNGSFGSSLKVGSAMEKASANWQTLTAATLATMGSAMGGVYVMNKLYQWKREKILKDKVEAARQEYLGMLADSPEKLGTSIDCMFAPAGFDKEAAGAFGMLNYPLAAAALLGILGAGGTGYIVKTMLDSKARESEERGLDIPKVQRIIFKSNPKKKTPPTKEKKETKDVQVGAKGMIQAQDPTVDKDAEEIEVTKDEVDSIKAAIAVYIDSMDTSSRIMNDPVVKQAMDERGITARQFLKIAADFDPQAYAYITQAFNADPKLRQAFIDAAIAKHPTLKHFGWTSRLPLVNRLFKNKFNEQLSKAIGPDVVGTAQSIAARRQPVPKMASLRMGGLQADITGSLIGTTLANQNSAQEIADEILSAQAKAQEEAANRKTPEEVAENIQLVAKGPEAKEYLAKNKEKVRALLKRLVAQGKI